MSRRAISHRPSRVDVKELLRRSAQAGAEQAELQFADITGALKSVFVPVRRLDEVLDGGEWFDGSAIAGSTRELESDMYLRPDLATFSLASSSVEPICARFICDVVTPDGERYLGDSRSALRTIVEQARDDGLDYWVAPEVEFFLFPQDADGPQLAADGASGYFERSRGRSRQVELRIVSTLERMGIRIRSSHHEVATGQFELDLPFRDALHTADSLATLKPAVKEIAASAGLRASFMPKPLSDAAGSGMHTHQVALLHDGTNAFHDPQAPYGLSEVGRRFAAGQLHHAPGMSALLAPLVNSYKRLVPGYEAPIAGSWGRHNRSALLRVPTPAPDATSTLDGAGTRLELRLPDPSCNPYLAFAAMLTAGLDGLESGLELGPPMEEIDHGFQGGPKQTVPSLPASLGEALVALEDDDVIAAALGSGLIELFVAAKTVEWERYRRQVTPWELEAYLDEY
ncbi:MAG: glutamine synthetase family protein [Candidatus Limnocylindrales bacterium]